MELPQAALDSIQGILRVLDSAGHPSMVVGGVATFAWGDPRTTRVLDIAVLGSWDEVETIESILVEAGYEVEGPFSTEWGPRFIVPSKTGFPVDIFIDERSRLFDRRKEVHVGSRTVWVKSPEDVILEKVLSASKFPEERSRDLQDAVGILYKNSGTLNRSYMEDQARSDGTTAILNEAIETANNLEE